MLEEIFDKFNLIGFAHFILFIIIIIIIIIIILLLHSLIFSS